MAMPLEFFLCFDQIFVGLLFMSLSQGKAPGSSISLSPEEFRTAKFSGLLAWSVTMD